MITPKKQQKIEIIKRCGSQKKISLSHKEEAQINIVLVESEGEDLFTLHPLLLLDTSS